VEKIMQKLQKSHLIDIASKNNSSEFLSEAGSDPKTQSILSCKNFSIEKILAQQVRGVDQSQNIPKVL
jgi:hypothetical protein